MSDTPRYAPIRITLPVHLGSLVELLTAVQMALPSSRSTDGDYYYTQRTRVRLPVVSVEDGSLLVKVLEEYE